MDFWYQRYLDLNFGTLGLFASVNSKALSIGIIMLNLWDICKLKNNTRKAWLLVDVQSIFLTIPLSEASSENKRKATVNWCWHPVFSGSSYLQCYTATGLLRAFYSYTVHKRKPTANVTLLSFHPSPFHQIPRNFYKKKK